MSATMQSPKGELMHDYPLVDVWPKKEADVYDKSGHIFKFETTVPESGEWVYVETHDFHNQTGYSRNIQSWVMGMARRAVGLERIHESQLPPFKATNKVEVIVRVVPGD